MNNTAAVKYLINPDPLDIVWNIIFTIPKEKEMDYRRTPNQNLTYQKDLRHQISDYILSRYNRGKNPYAPTIPGGSLAGPEDILNKLQDVTDSANPVYSDHLSGFYHLNK